MCKLVSIKGYEYNPKMIEYIQYSKVCEGNHWISIRTSSGTLDSHRYPTEQEALKDLEDLREGILSCLN